MRNYLYTREAVLSLLVLLTKGAAGEAYNVANPDISVSIREMAAEGKTEKMDMPTTSNVLQYFTADGTKISVRPSGTEPKIKFYIEVHGTMQSAADYDKANAQAMAKIEEIKKDLGIA